MGYSKVTAHELESAGPGGAVRFVAAGSVSSPSGSTGSP